MMQEKSPEPISAAECEARLRRAKMIARRLGFKGTVEYRHVYSHSGGAQYAMGQDTRLDTLVVEAEAFRREFAGDDFSLEAMIAHECGHQLLCRDKRLVRHLPKELSPATEEVLASLIGSVIVEHERDSEALIMKALGELVDHGLKLADASRRVEDVLKHLETLL